MDKKIILFDWDDTLFSKTEYKKRLRSSLAKICQTTEEEIFDYEEKYFESLARSDDFQIDDFVNSFSQKFDRKINIEDFSTDNLGIYSRALFPEADDVLKKMRDKYNLGIYSQGFVSLQKLKIKHSGIEGYFDQSLIFIDRNKTQPEFIQQIPVGVTVIDDKKEVIEVLKNSRSDLNLIWVNRQDDSVLDDVRTIKSLEELL